jgi:Outer membrane protein beta-barrel domain
MHPVFRRLLITVVVARAVCPQALMAAPHIRTGFCAGVGFGIESVSWTDQGDRQPAKNSGTGNARVGYAVKPDLVVGVEFWSWARNYDISTTTLPVPVDVRLTATTACMTYFPGAAGFFMRLGAGFAYGRVAVEPPSSVTSVPATTDSESGLAFDFAPGYEFRLAQRFALGAQADVVYLGLGDVLENAFGYGLSAQFNWYW